MTRNHSSRRPQAASRRMSLRGQDNEIARWGRRIPKGPSGNNLHIWVSDDGWLWSISKRKTGGIPRVFLGFFALKSAADGRQLAPKCASYFLTGPKVAR